MLGWQVRYDGLNPSLILGTGWSHVCVWLEEWKGSVFIWWEGWGWNKSIFRLNTITAVLPIGKTHRSRISVTNPPILKKQILHQILFIHEKFFRKSISPLLTHIVNPVPLLSQLAHGHARRCIVISSGLATRNFPTWHVGPMEQGRRGWLRNFAWSKQFVFLI